MTHTKVIFLRHADTQKDPTVHASQWGLSDSGTAAAEGITDVAALNEVEVIYVSEEPKTLLTVNPLATKLGLTPIQDQAFNEVARGEKFLSKEEFEQEKNKQLEDLTYAAFNGESGEVALARFTEGVKRVVEVNTGKTVLIVTHGTVLNIYFADVLGLNAHLPERWAKTGFCAYGIIENGTVVKDII